MANTHDYSIIPPSAVFGSKWPSNPNITQGYHGALSVAGWTSGNEGYPQQTFLGASIRSFNVSAGFGDSSSTMGIELVNDEFNTSDSFGIGYGDDVYHNGSYDKFNPPVVGSPVFFKFGQNYATVEQAFRKDFDQIYNTNTLEMPRNPFRIRTETWPISEHKDGYYLLDKDVKNNKSRWIDKSDLLKPDTKWRGFAHFTFGGILQSYTENRSTGGNPLYSVKLVDPREILTNTQLILNNYQGTTFGNKNLYNIYGFLEYDPSDKLVKELETKCGSKSVLEKKVSTNGDVAYIGTDEYLFPGVVKIQGDSTDTSQSATISGSFPITGQGFSRRSDNGIPWYRVNQAMTALFSYNGDLPKEYIDAGFGGVIDFRGYNYVVDWGGIPTEQIPQSYYIDFDQISMMDLAQELCQILSRDLYVSLLPVIDHPSCQFLFDKNQEVVKKAENEPEDSPMRSLILGSGLVAGIIRIDSIDKKEQPSYGAIKSYLDDLESNGIYVENRDVGFELSNVTTDKFIAGAQEVEMYYFNGLRDRDNYLDRLKDTGDAEAQQRLEQLNHDKWTLETNQNQQILPFYGFIGDKAVTIPRGFGSYQQILLDARHLDAHGVGAYYIATEMELRAAAISFKQWMNFLLTYNEVYIQELSNNQAFYADLGVKLTDVVAGINDQIDPDGDVKKQLDQLSAAGRNFGVSVPRSVWNSDKSSEDNVFDGKMGPDGFPANPCCPPFGYPLYYKRAEKIGIPQAGLTKVTSGLHTVITNIENLENLERSDKQRFSFNKTTANNNIIRLRALIKQKEDILTTAGAGASIEDIQALQKDIKILQDKINIITSNLTNERDELKKLRDARGIQIAELKSTVKNSTGIIKNISKYQRDSLNNAQKVYNFLKKVADDNLGKKFLVKIPRACNVNWSSEITTENGAWDIIKGPFGFSPQPISTIPDYQGSDTWKAKLQSFHSTANKAERSGPTPIKNGAWPTRSNVHWHYLDVDAMGQAATETASPDLVAGGSGYTYGALKCNYNPITEQWEFNYKPEPQGGFFNYALFDKNLKSKEAILNNVSNTILPKVNSNVLAPYLMDKIVEKNGRIQCYARYDHSQHLDFSSINPSEVEQQSISDNIIIPDVMETLPNLNPEAKESLNQIQSRLEDDKNLGRQPESVAFVKCNLDEDLYMSPKVVVGDARVWAEEFTIALAPTPYEVVYVPGTDDYEGCKVPKEVKKRPIPIFGVKNGGLSKNPIPQRWDDFDREYSETYNGWIIKTEAKDLDPKHVYALITVPGRIIPTVDKRYVDGPLKSMNGVSIANSLTEDVVKINEFRLPGTPGAINKTVDCSKLPEGVQFTFEDISRAIQSQKDAAKGISLSSNGDKSILAFTSPSPVYPDIVAIPLMSMEKCYGPWLSSALDGNTIGAGNQRYSDIGGKIEFEKDETLAPWNYAGYQLMDEAAKLKTQFSNSLLLFSERGSFSYPSAPIDVSLAKALKDKGPLVTSISVDVGTNSIKTSVQLNLYTSQFGKLQKQKEIAISQIARERQKITDQNNLLRRRGIGKGSANMDMLGGLLKNGGQKLIDAAKSSNDIFTALEKGDVQKATQITISATPNTEKFDNGDLSVEIESTDYEGVSQSESQVGEMAGIYRDEKEFDEAKSRTAGATWPDLFKGTSDNPHDPYFASRRPNVQSRIDRRTLG